MKFLNSLICFTCVFGGMLASAEDDNEFDQSRYLEVTPYFPNNPFKQIVSGQATELLLGFRNTGTGEMIIKNLAGAFVHPQDHSVILRNLSDFRVGLRLPPKHSATVQYRFKVEIEAGSVALQVVSSCLDEDQHGFAVVGFNETLAVVEPELTFDIQMLSLYMIGTGFLGLCCYLVFVAFFGNATTKSTKKAVSPVSSPTEEQSSQQAKEVNDDWIPAHVKQIESMKSSRRRKN